MFKHIIYMQTLRIFVLCLDLSCGNGWCSLNYRKEDQNLIASYELCIDDQINQERILFIYFTKNSMERITIFLLLLNSSAFSPQKKVFLIYLTLLSLFLSTLHIKC